MDQIKRGVAMLVSIDRLPGPNALKEINKRTGTDFSAVLARAGERTAAPVMLPIAKSVRSLSQNGSAPIPIPIPMSGSVDPSTNERFHERALGQGSLDGNTVDMDVERAKFAENALMYEYEVDRVKGFYKSMDDLLKNTPY